MSYPPYTFEAATTALIEVGRYMHARGWAPATSGNFSARLGNGEYAITVSGRHKGRLTPHDIMRVDANGRALDGKKPSAETLLHTAIYRRHRWVHAVLHPHTLHATLLTRRPRRAVELEGYELLKALRGIDTHETRVELPVFANDQNIARLAARIDEQLDREGPVHGYVIAGHGFYTWGDSVDAALRQVEALEFMFECEWRMQEGSQS